MIVFLLLSIVTLAGFILFLIVFKIIFREFISDNQIWSVAKCSTRMQLFSCNKIVFWGNKIDAYNPIGKGDRTVAGGSDVKDISLPVHSKVFNNIYYFICICIKKKLCQLFSQ